MADRQTQILFTPLTVEPLIRLAGLTIFLKLKIQVLLQITSFYLLNLGNIAGLIRIRVLLEVEPN